jgi:hypothetical protein
VSVIVCLHAAHALAATKERRLWVDPPPAAPASAPPDIRFEPQAPPLPDVEVTDSIVTPPAPVADPGPPLDASPTSHSSCTTRTYTVPSGGIVRVHAC